MMAPFRHSSPRKSAQSSCTVRTKLPRNRRRPECRSCGCACRTPSRPLRTDAPRKYACDNDHSWRRVHPAGTTFDSRSGNVGRRRSSSQTFSARRFVQFCGDLTRASHALLGRKSMICSKVRRSGRIHQFVRRGDIRWSSRAYGMDHALVSIGMGRCKLTYTTLYR